MPPVTVGVGYQSQCAVMILDHDNLNRESNTDKNMNDITHSFVIFSSRSFQCHVTENVHMHPYDLVDSRAINGT